MKTERGFTLVELLITMAILTVLLCMALPSAVQVQRVAAEKHARDRALQVWQIVGSDTTCHALTPSQCNALDKLIPPAGTAIEAGPYTYTFSGIAADGSWSYLGVPNQPGMYTVQIGNVGGLTCNGGGC